MYSMRTCLLRGKHRTFEFYGNVVCHGLISVQVVFGGRDGGALKGAAKIHEGVGGSLRNH